MTKDTTYNGHKNWSHWNVALWIGNDEPLYRSAMEHIERARKDRRTGKERATESALIIAARRLVAELPDRTPDGARYSKTAVKAALAGLVE